MHGLELVHAVESSHAGLPLDEASFSHHSLPVTDRSVLRRQADALLVSETFQYSSFVSDVRRRDGVELLWDQCVSVKVVKAATHNVEVFREVVAVASQRRAPLHGVC